MKQLIIFLTSLFGLSNFTIAQIDFGSVVHPSDSVHSAYENRMDEIFANVDFSYIPSGILYDRGFPFIDLDFFQGDLVEESKASLLSFGLAYASIATMEVSESNILPAPSNYRNVLDSIDSQSDVIVLAGIHRI